MSDYCHLLKPLRWLLMRFKSGMNQPGSVQRVHDRLFRFKAVATCAVCTSEQKHHGCQFTVAIVELIPFLPLLYSRLELFKELSSSFLDDSTVASPALAALVAGN